MTSLQRRLQKLELRSLAYGLDARPDGESKRFVIARIEAIRQRQQAARDRGVYVAPADVGYVKQRLRAFLDGRENRAW
jgi:hypothetical protein